MEEIEPDSRQQRSYSLGSYNPLNYFKRNSKKRNTYIREPTSEKIKKIILWQRQRAGPHHNYCYDYPWIDIKKRQRTQRKSHNGLIAKLIKMFL